MQHIQSKKLPGEFITTVAGLRDSLSKKTAVDLKNDYGLDLTVAEVLLELLGIHPEAKLEDKGNYSFSIILLVPLLFVIPAKSTTHTYPLFCFLKRFFERTCHFC